MQIFLLLLFLLSSLFANETIFTENDPSFLVEGVSVISGDFYEYEEDYTVQGAEPIHVRHACLPNSIPVDSNHLICTYSCDLMYGGFKLHLTEPNGTTFVYTPDALIPNHLKKCERFSAWKMIGAAAGITNTASGRISAQTNVWNHSVVFDQQKSYKDPIPGFTLYAADGTIRRYKAAEGQVRQKVGVPDNKGG